ncbi:MAG: hypothetical protein RLZZ210_712 [Pseudomonadota bacterium]
MPINSKVSQGNTINTSHVSRNGIQKKKASSANSSTSNIIRATRSNPNNPQLNFTPAPAKQSIQEYLKTADFSVRYFWDMLGSYYGDDGHMVTDPKFLGKNGVLNHTIEVMRNFETHFERTFEQQTGVNAQFMRGLLALHDVAKGTEKLVGEKQHALSKGIIKKDVSDNIPDELKKAWIVLISHDVIGQTDMGHINITQAALSVYNMYHKLKKYVPEVSIASVLRMIEIFYRCDAGSYIDLRQKLMKNENSIEFNDRVAGVFEAITKKVHSLPQEYPHLLVKEANYITYFNDGELLKHSFDSWMAKYKDKFPANSAFIFDIDGTITSTMVNSLSEKINMRHVLLGLLRNNIKVKLISNRKDDIICFDQKSVDDLIKGVPEKYRHLIEVITNPVKDDKTREYTMFKHKEFEKINQNSVVIGSAGDSLWDIHSYHFPELFEQTQEKYGFKPKSFWVQTGKDPKDFHDDGKHKMAPDIGIRKKS